MYVRCLCGLIDAWIGPFDRYDSDWMEVLCKKREEDGVFVGTSHEQSFLVNFSLLPRDGTASNLDDDVCYPSDLSNIV